MCRKFLNYDAFLPWIFVLSVHTVHTLNEMLHYAAFHHGLYCLQSTCLPVSMQNENGKRAIHDND